MLAACGLGWRAVRSAHVRGAEDGNGMFADLDATLATLLKRELPRPIVEQVSISFAAPGEDLSANVTLPAIDLFLYEIHENTDLRDRNPVFDRRTDGTVHRTLAPVRVDCHYLVTAWPRPGGTQPELVEHELLGCALRVLLRHREIPEEVLQGSMKRQPMPLRAAAIQAQAQKPRGDFWLALGGKPKAAFDYRVTLCVDVEEPEEAGTVVRSSSLGT